MMRRVTHWKNRRIRLPCRFLSSSINSSTSLDESTSLLLKSSFHNVVNKEGQFQLLTPKQMETFGKKYDWSNNKNEENREASVLVLLCSIEGSLSVMFTRRASHLALHASEISFPGGHYQPEEDESLEHTALREADEELLPKPVTLIHDNISIIGKTTRIPSLKGTPVTPIIGCLKNIDLKKPLSSVFPGDRSEVDLVFGISVKELLQCETSEKLPENRFGMQIAPVFPTEHGKIWGLTALILRPLLHRWLGPTLFPKVK